MCWLCEVVVVVGVCWCVLCVVVVCVVVCGVVVCVRVGGVGVHGIVCVCVSLYLWVYECRYLHVWSVCVKRCI